jgi:hypothetical protein
LLMLLQVSNPPPHIFKDINFIIYAFFRNDIGTKVPWTWG